MLLFFGDFEANFISIERISFFERFSYQKNYKTVAQERKKLLFPPTNVNLRSLTMPHSMNLVQKGKSNLIM
jgi:hypothetical protein